MKNKIFLFVFLLAAFSYAQKESERWDEKADPYLLRKSPEIFEPDNNTTSLTSVFLDASISLYRFVISDQDGDNCPFYPSCSHFFVESVTRTNILQGMVMFGDRFTRDMNIIDRRSKYPFIKNKRLYDPPELYLFDPDVVYPPK